MARPSVLDNLLALTGEIGLNVVDIVPTPLAQFSALQGSALKDNGAVALVVNVGSSATEVAVGSSHGVMFARSFSIGGQMFTDALARARKISAGQAENLKVAQGRLGPDFEGSDALRGVADMWVSELQSCLSVFKSVFPATKHQPVRMLLTGGGACLDGFVPYVGEKMSMAAALAEELPGKLKAEQPCRFVAAAGLAFSGFPGAVGETVSLLPPRLRDELAFREQKPLWVGAGVAAALILTVSLVGGYRDFRRKEDQLSEQRASLRRRQQLVDSIESVKAENDYIRSLAQPVKDLTRAAPVVRDLVALVSQAKAQDDWITMICDAESYFKWREMTFPKRDDRKARDHRRLARPAQPSEEEPTIGFNRVVIVGNTRSANLYTVRELIAQLSQSGLVESADLLSDDMLVMDGEKEGNPTNRPSETVSFAIDVRLAQK
jgi:hypothetical protein